MASPDLMPAFLKMISALALVIGIALIVLWLFRKLMKGSVGLRSDAEAIKIVSSKYMGSKHSIALVDVIGHILVVGLSPTGMSLLAHLDDKDSHDRLLCMHEAQGTDVPFAEHVARLTSRFSSLSDAGEKKSERNA